MEASEGADHALMQKYVRKELPEQIDQNQDHEIRITGPGKTRNYIAYATGLLMTKGYTAVELKAMGQAINKTVTIAEIIKRRIPGLHQNNKITSISIQDTWEPIEQGLDSISIIRHVSVICITLSTLPLSTSSPGYQPPLPPEMVKQLNVTPAQQSPPPPPHPLLPDMGVRSGAPLLQQPSGARQWVGGGPGSPYNDPHNHDGQTIDEYMQSMHYHATGHFPSPGTVHFDGRTQRPGARGRAPVTQRHTGAPLGPNAGGGPLMSSQQQLHAMSGSLPTGSYTMSTQSFSSLPSPQAPHVQEAQMAGRRSGGGSSAGGSRSGAADAPTSGAATLYGSPAPPGSQLSGMALACGSCSASGGTSSGYGSLTGSYSALPGA